MDWHKLQHKLFELDPTDPREDLAKLTAAAQGSSSGESVSGKDYLNESIDVSEGSLKLDRDYSVADFAALAGVTLSESQKIGSAGQLKAKDSIKKNPAGTTKNPTKDKLVGEDFKDAWKAGADNFNNIGLFKAGMNAMGDEPKSSSKDKSVEKTKSFKNERPAIGSTEPGAWRAFLKQHTAQLQQIAADPEKKKRFDTWMSKWAESVEEAEVMKFKVPNTVKQRDPNWRDMEALRKSGAAGTHKDKKKDMKSGKTKHKSQQYESIKDRLWAALKNKDV